MAMPIQTRFCSLCFDERKAMNAKPINTAKILSWIHGKYCKALSSGDSS